MTPFNAAPPHLSVESAAFTASRPSRFGNTPMGALIQRHDWAATRLGPTVAWPQALRTLVDVMLGAQQPMFVAWGADRTLIYNDGYAEILGRKHPHALGRPLLDVWSEIRADLAPIVDQAYAGESVHMDDITLIVERHGYPEETHFSFSYTPVRDSEQGAVAGIFCPCTETTAQVIAERRMRESEAEARGVLEGMAEGFILLDHQFRIQRINAEGLRIDGRPQAEILGRHLLEVWPEARDFPTWPLCQRLMATRTAEQVTYRHRSDVHDVWLEVRAYPSGDGLAMFYRDVTATVRNEQALRESEAQFRALAQAMPNHAWTARPDGTLDWFNQRVLTYSGVDPHTGATLPWTAIVHPDDVAHAGAAWAHALQTGEDYAVEFRIRRADGAYRWHLVRAQPIRADDGTIIQWVGTNTDIEAQKVAATALADLNAELERRVAARTADRDRIWRNSRDLLLVVDRDGMFRAVNPAWTAILGYEPEAMVGHRCSEFVWPDDADSTLDALQAAISKGNLTNFENRYRHKDGTVRWIAWNTSAEGDLVYAYGRDVTAEKGQAEALRAAEDALRQSQKMEAVGQLTGGLAHDFNNLLTGIWGNLELLQLRVAQGRLKDLERYVAAAQSAAKRAAALTHRLLAFSRRQTLDPRPTDINRLASDMEELIRRTVGPAITLELISAAGLWTTLVDPNQLENALLNLCINARDAMPNGGRLSIATANRWFDPRAALEHHLKPGGYVSLSVADTGSGMTPDVVRRAFDPFFTTKPIGEGTGLGLSMIYGFVQQSGGQARIQSEVGRGTAVTLYLPRHAGTADRPQDEAGAPDSIQPGRGETVLVVDDEAAVRMLVAEVLQDRGYVVIEAADGIAGLAALQSPQRIDLLVTDVGLPGGLNGRQVADAGLAIRPGLKVLFITGYAEQAVLGDGQLAPGMHVLIKPFAMEALAARIKDLLSTA